MPDVIIFNAVISSCDTGLKGLKVRNVSKLLDGLEMATLLKTCKETVF